MTNLVFLGARLPLTKTFVSEHGRITSAPYPHVTRVTSYHESYKTLQDFKDLLDLHADKRRCLFGGQLVHPLQGESRAGKTLSAPREWVVFDFDKVEAKDHTDVVARYLPAECQNVSYIVQMSASMFRPDTSLWSGHIFMLLREPADEQRVKQWFEYINFNLPALTNQIRLSDSLQALHWPLDRTVAYGSKLIYIASPKCVGFEPAIKQHIVLVKKKQQNVAIPAFNPIDHFAVRQKINELRRAAGEEEIEYQVVPYDGHEMLKKTDVCDIQDIRASGDHYIRFNLNGGDSYAYFIDLRNPDVIRNFKGEPYLKTADAAPDLYKALRKAAPEAIKREPLEDGSEVLAFYATNHDSKLKLGCYNGESQSLWLKNTSIDAAKSWLFEHGLIQKVPFPHRDLVFNPQDMHGFIPGSTTINVFSPSPYMSREKASEIPSTLADLPPVLSACLRSALGPCEEVLVERFINWIAYVFQYREKAQTAWVLSGVEGTGKNTLVSHYLRPVFGEKYVVSTLYQNLEKEFNGFLEQALLMIIEEADIRSVENQEGMGAKLRHYITDTPLMIRRMGTDHLELPNYSSFILMSNKPTPAPISSTDRRFNFAEYQDTKWNPTPNQVKVFTTGSELDQFADLLARWPVDVQAVRQIVDTQARRDAFEATTSVNQLIAEAIKHGDLQFFIDRMPTEAEANFDFNNRFNPMGLFKAAIAKYQAEAELGDETLVGEEEAFILFRTLISDSRYFQDSKTWRKRHYKALGLDFDKQHRIGKGRPRGVKVTWQPATIREDDIPAPKSNSNVTSMSSKRKAK